MNVSGHRAAREVSSGAGKCNKSVPIRRWMAGPGLWSPGAFRRRPRQTRRRAPRARRRGGGALRGARAAGGGGAAGVLAARGLMPGAGRRDRAGRRGWWAVRGGDRVRRSRGSEQRDRGGVGSEPARAPRQLRRAGRDHLPDGHRDGRPAIPDAAAGQLGRPLGGGLQARFRSRRRPGRRPAAGDRPVVAVRGGAADPLRGRPVVRSGADQPAARRGRGQRVGPGAGRDRGRGSRRRRCERLGVCVRHGGRDGRRRRAGHARAREPSCCPTVRRRPRPRLRRR